MKRSSCGSSAGTVNGRPTLLVEGRERTREEFDMPRLDQASTATWLIVAVPHQSSARAGQRRGPHRISCCFVESVAKSLPARKFFGIAASGHTWLLPA